MNCEEVKEQYNDELNEIIAIQRNQGREAIFFMYEDGSSSDIIRGEATSIRIPPERQRQIFEAGEVIGSIHTHPAGFDPSTIDIMTAVRTDQDLMGVAVPITFKDGRRDFTLSIVDSSGVGPVRENMLFRSMRRSSFGITDTGRDFRKQVNVQRSGVEGCRTHKVVKEGIEFPGFDRPSFFDIEAGRELGVVENQDDMFLD